tara:strand:+ start:398 stop:631 length:234 start_codon:yes stop_codon:yes gene_type:complete
MTLEGIIKKIIDDWKLQVKDMTDEELKEDRSEWMKTFGQENDSEVDIDSSIHTLSIEIEQLRRYQKIIYKDSLITEG